MSDEAITIAYANAIARGFDPAEMVLFCILTKSPHLEAFAELFAPQRPEDRWLFGALQWTAARAHFPERLHEFLDRVHAETTDRQVLIVYMPDDPEVVVIVNQPRPALQADA